MRDTRQTEATLDDTNHVLVVLSELDPAHLGGDFFGSTVTLDQLASTDLFGKSVYLAGDLSRLQGGELERAARCRVIEELSRGFDGTGFERVDLGKVPIRIGGAGVYYRRLFADSAETFERIRGEHTFQALTESSKPSKAHRTGIYLTPVEHAGDELHFHLLRCSTNLAGPTENFGATDRRIVDTVNRVAASIFRDHAPLNHVLAQIYGNTPAGDGHKQTKARISAHADKTKDMPVDGIMAFCTFYSGLGSLEKLDRFDHFDYGHKGKTGLTRLTFRLKESVIERAGLVPELSLTLYPGSVFFMPLSTNRRYTHEIQASMLNAEMLPTRLGYVVRCSKTRAVHTQGRTFLDLDGERVPMEPPTEEGMRELRALYAEENRSDAFIDYGDRFRFSMNAGDYQAPDPKRG
jgi:hypothetical protein